MAAIWRVAAISILRSLAMAATVAASLRRSARRDIRSGGTLIAPQANLDGGGSCLLSVHRRPSQQRPYPRQRH
jgi:hypothetical protein